MGVGHFVGYHHPWTADNAYQTSHFFFTVTHTSLCWMPATKGVPKFNTVAMTNTYQLMHHPEQT